MPKIKIMKELFVLVYDCDEVIFVLNVEESEMEELKTKYPEYGFVNCRLFSKEKFEEEMEDGLGEE